MEVISVEDMPADVVDAMLVDMENAAPDTVDADRGAGPSMISRVDLDLVLATHAIVAVFN